MGDLDSLLKLCVGCIAFIVGTIALGTIFSRFDKDSSPEDDDDWEPLTADKREWPGPHYPVFVCPRCHSSNVEEGRVAISGGTLGITGVKFTHYCTCRYCGKEFNYATNSGRNGHSSWRC